MPSRKLFLLAFLSILPILFFAAYQPAQASVIKDLMNGVKKIVSPSPTPKPLQLGSGNLSVSSNVALAANGDINQDSVIDGGDMVTFSYTISNNTNNDYPYSTLKTNLPRDLINYIHNVKGAYSIEDKDGSTEIPNLYIHAHQLLKISFDARVDIFTGADKGITTQPQLYDRENKKLVENSKSELGIKGSDKISSNSALLNQIKTLKK
jgi:hypothetical protein